MNDYDVLIVPGGSVGRTTSGVPIALVRLGKDLSLAEPKLLLYPLPVSNPTIQRLPIFITGTPVCPVLRTTSRAAFGSRSRFTDFSSYYATVQDSTGRRRG